ncbi:EAL and HDOD domain-containing protein [Azospira sp. APE16]|uniref:EAL and HDOD domain-containing protein n=1 Tax=Azospira sp. APE16 TaxID=3394231 RepID=UPI003A4E1A52
MFSRLFRSRSEVPAAAEAAAPVAPAASGAAAPATPPVAPLPGEEQRHSFVRREPIVNRLQRVAAYEFNLEARLASRLGGRSAVVQRSLQEALFHELALASGESGVLGQRLAFVPVSPDALDSAALARLPRQNTVLMLALPPDVEAEALPPPATLVRLRQEGFLLGMYVPPDKAALAALRPHLDYVAVDVAAFDGERLRNLAYALKTVDGHTVHLIADNVQTADEFNLCFQRGFDYFQGRAVSLKEAWAPAKGAASRMRIIQLLNLVRNEAENKELAETLKQDPLLSFRILRYINSPGIGLTTPVSSIEHALVVLGLGRFYRWLSLLLFAPQGGGFGEWLVVEHALTRGRLMELLGAGRFPPAEHDALFLCGSFSLLDRLLQQPLAEVVGQLTLPPAVKQALLQRQGPYAQLLEVAEACESLESARIESAAQAAGLEAEATNRAMIMAMAWANEVGELGGSDAL